MESIMTRIQNSMNVESNKYNCKVSICIPTYNNPDDVERLLQSIAQQTFRDYEVNISDDSTNNAIQELVEQYKDKINRISYIHNEKPLGHIFNWNAAIKMAAGEYIKIMFSDDWFTTGKSLGQFVDLLDKNPQADLAFCGSRQVMLADDVDKVSHASTEHKEKSYDRHAESEFIQKMQEDYRHLFLGNQIGCPSAIIYRRKDDLYLFDEESNWASDMFLYFDILQDNPRFAFTLEPLVSIGMHEHQYTETFQEHDTRVYTDYRYLFTKYHLIESRVCREYFTDKFVVGYKQGFIEAKRLGISMASYMKWRSIHFKNMVKCFLRNRFEG